MEWPETNCVRMRLSEAAAVDRLVALARQEAACCPFFRFSVEIEAHRLVFTASVPADAVSVLEEFAQLAAR